MKSTIILKSVIFAAALFATGCRQVTGPTPPSDLVFATTIGMYSETANLDSAVKAELGTSYRIADWNDVKSYCAAHPIDSLYAMIAWSPWDTAGGNSIDTTRQNFFVLWNGQGFWPQDPTRHYFTTRFDHNVPSTWLVQDQIDSSAIVLGSWYGVSFRVLAVKP